MCHSILKLNFLMSQITVTYPSTQHRNKCIILTVILPSLWRHHTGAALVTLFFYKYYHFPIYLLVSEYLQVIFFWLLKKSFFPMTNF